MNLSADLREFIGLLNSRGVEYVIVGAHSLAFHGRPRYTGDLDILLNPSSANAEKVVSVLVEFGFADFQPSDFLEPDQMIQLGRVPNRIDLFTGISGVATSEPWQRRYQQILREFLCSCLAENCSFRISAPLVGLKTLPTSTH